MDSLRTVAAGSIIRFTAPGSRTTDGEPRVIPGIVIDQDPEDGMLTVFAFHFEGQYLARVPIRVQKFRVEIQDGKEIRVPYWEDSIDVVMDAQRSQLFQRISALDNSSAEEIRQSLGALRQTVIDDLQTVQRQMSEFQEQVLSMITAPGDADAPAGAEPGRRSRK